MPIEPFCPVPLPGAGEEDERGLLETALGECFMLYVRLGEI